MLHSQAMCGSKGSLKSAAGYTSTPDSIMLCYLADLLAGVQLA